LLSEIKTVYKVGRGMVDREAAQKTAETTAEETAEAEGAADPEPAEVQSAESPAETPAVAQASADPLAGEAVSHDKVQPASADEPVLRPEGDGAASKVALGKPAAPPQRSAAARRWGESSE
jgi:hypothetical protein